MEGLRQIVERYSALAKNFGDPVLLEKFALGREKTEKVFSALDEDYHISRFLHFSAEQGPAYHINGQAVTHVALDSAIVSLL